MAFTKFYTKIVQRFDNGFEYYELLLPDGQCVHRGSLESCWSERDHWENVCRIQLVQLSLF